MLWNATKFSILKRRNSNASYVDNHLLAEVPFRHTNLFILAGKLENVQPVVNPSVEKVASHTIKLFILERRDSNVKYVESCSL